MNLKERDRKSRRKKRKENRTIQKTMNGWGVIETSKHTYNTFTCSIIHSRVCGPCSCTSFLSFDHAIFPFLLVCPFFYTIQMHTQNNSSHRSLAEISKLKHSLDTEKQNKMMTDREINTLKCVLSIDTAHIHH